MNHAALILSIGGYLTQLSYCVLMTDRNGFPEKPAVRQHLEDVVCAFQDARSITSDRYAPFHTSRRLLSTLPTIFALQMHFLAVELHVAFCTLLEDQQFAVEDDGLCALDS
jgi:hypothetical protein